MTRSQIEIAISHLQGEFTVQDIRRELGARVFVNCYSMRRWMKEL